VALGDEATSALDQTNEAVLYRAAAAAGITMVSVGHRPALVKFHQRVLELQPGGEGWQVVPAAEYVGAAA
jgi:putative ATP-binding cassette transporter